MESLSFCCCVTNEMDTGVCGLEIGLYLSSTADGRLVIGLRPGVDALCGIALGAGGCRSLRGGSVALDAKMSGLRGDLGVGVVGIIGVVRPIDPRSASILPYSSVNTSLPPSFPPPFSLRSETLALARATIRALILASLAANLTGSWPSHSRSGVDE
jgi:hypothetical protein